MTYAKLAAHVKQQLCKIYPDVEAHAIQNQLFQEISNLSSIKLLQSADEIPDKAITDKIYAALERLMQYEPLQYVLGKAWFLDLELLVSPDVLIPRPETEELIKLIKQKLNNKVAYDMLDIGTGSGAIAIALAKLFTRSKVFACDISESALQMAQKNAKRQHADVSFFKQDILNVLVESSQNEYINKHFDVIVSNPPYVKDSEKVNMRQNVLNYEPPVALFVQNDEPLLFYTAIVEYSNKNLKEGGYLFFEINESESLNLIKLLEKYGYQDIAIIDDFRDKPRFLVATKPKMP